MTEFMGLAEKVSKFNQEAMKHMERQTLNPFSGRFSRSPSPRPKFSKEEYGKPAAGSKTEARGQRAFTQISKEVLELCEVIHDMGARRRDSDGDECIIIPFGELFAFYTKISDKVVGLLIAAKKRGFVWFEPEILFQRRDDDVLIALLKPIGEIRNVINRAISASPSPAPAVSSDPEKAPSGSSTPSPLSRQNSNSSFDTTLTTEKSEPSPTPATSETEPAASSVENTPQESSPSTQTVELVQTASTPGTLFPVEEEQVSSEASVVESKLEPTLEAATEAESSSTVVPEPTVAEKENAEIKEETAPSEETPSVETATTSEETVTLPTVTSEEVVPVPATSEEAVSSTVTSEEVSPTIVTSEETAPTTATDETIPPTTTPEEEQISEPSEASTEKVLKIEPIAASEDQESLTLKIIVEVEPDQIPSTSTLAEPEVESSPALEQNSSSSEVPVEDETSTSALEVAPGDNEQTSSSPATTIEPEDALSSSDKSEVVIPSKEEQTPPSNDTGEKTLA